MTPQMREGDERAGADGPARRRRTACALCLGLLFAVVLGLPALASAAWREPVGGVRPISDIGSGPSLASVGGVPYVAWSEIHGATSEVFVARLSADGTSWVKVGGPVNFSTAETASQANLTSVGGVPYVAWTEFDTGGNSGEVRVARLNAAGTAWEEPWRGVDATHGGISQNSADDSEVPIITSVGGVPYVTWDEENSAAPYAFEVRAARLDNTTTPLPTWVQPGTGVSATSGGINATSGLLPTIASVGGVPYVAWIESEPSPGQGQLLLQVRVARLNQGNGNWEQPWTGESASYGGITQSPTGNAALNFFGIWPRPSLASINGFPYIAWVENDGTNFDARVARLDTSTHPLPTWTQVAAGVSATDGRINASPTNNAEYLSLAAVDAAPFGTQVPYLAWEELTGPAPNQIGVVRAARFNAATRAWEEPWPGVSATSGAINLDPAESADTPTLGVINGVPYIGRSDGGTRVSRLEPEFSAASATPSTTGATLTVHAHTYGIAYPIGFRYGNALQSTTATPAAPLGTDNVTITATVSGLAPATNYQFQPFALAGTPFPPVLGTAAPFTTKASTTGSTTTTTGSSTLATISALSETNLVFRAGRASTALLGQAAGRHHPRGTVFSFRLDQRANITVTVYAKLAGRRSGGSCKPAGRRLAGRPRCTRTVAVATFARSGHAGANKVAFTARIRGKALKPGSYEASFTATDLAGSSNPASLGFTIVKH